jgi:hypothetical protein
MTGPNSGMAFWYEASRQVGVNNSTLLSPCAFDAADWIKSQCTISANGTTDPGGATLADGMIESAVVGAHTVSQNPGALVTTIPAIMSVYLKAGARTWGILQSDGRTAYVNLTTGAKGASGGAESSLTVTSAGNGWWHCQFAPPTPFAADFTIYGATSDGGFSYAGDAATVGIWMYGASVSQTKVSSWGDASQLGRTLSQAVPANQPLWNARGPNGRPYVSFDTSGTNSLGPALFTLPQPVNVFLVTRINAFTGAGGKDILFDGGTAASDFILLSSTANQAFRPNAAIGSSSTLVANGVFALIDVAFNGASSEGYVNGVLTASGDAGAAAMGGFTMGSLADGTRGMNADFAEVIGYNFIVSGDWRQKIRSYLRGKYAL